MKIAMVSFRLPLAGPQKRGLKRGGVERVAHDLAQGLALRGHQVTVWSADPAPPGSAYRARPMPGARLIHHWLGFRLVSGYLGNLLALFPRYGDAQAVIAHGDSLLLPLRGIPVLRIMHGSALDEAITARSPARALLQFGVFLQEWLTASTQTTVAISRNTQKRYPAIREVIPNGVDQTNFFADSRPKAPEPTILFVGTLGGRKRGRLLLEAFINIIQPSLPGVQLWMVGEPGPPAEGVHYYSNLSTEVLAERYRRAWVFASPSSYEGFGLPYLEAMACGTAVVASSNPGSRELLDGGRYGNLVERDADFPAAVLEMLRDAELRERYVACGLERARQLTLARMVDRYERLLAPQAASPLSLGASA